MNPAQKRDFDRSIKFGNTVRAIRIAAQGHADETGRFELAAVYRIMEPYINKRQWRGFLGVMTVQKLYAPVNSKFGRIVQHGR
jgi:hypothetical protein